MRRSVRDPLAELDRRSPGISQGRNRKRSTDSPIRLIEYDARCLELAAELLEPGDLEADVAEHATLLLSLSTSFFPEGRERALDSLGNPEEEVHFPFGANFASGLGLGVRFPI